MLKSHHNLLEPRPADRLRIGERVVDVPLREVSAADGGEPVRITVKALNVLLTLVAHAGKPVSREALLEWVWPDTLPTDDVLTQAVTQLRKALGDERDRPRYIETIAKQGYRLVAAVEWLPDPAEAAPPVASPAAVRAGAAPAGAAPSARHRSRWWWAVAAILIAAAALAYLGSRGTPRTQSSAQAGIATTTSATPTERPHPFDFLRIASQPEVEESPSLSPDGALVVYSRHRSGARFGASLAIQTASATSPRALTESVEGRNDRWPAWSPDGRWVAFVRTTDSACKVIEVPAAGGSPRELADCIGSQPHAVSWYPDGSALIAAGRPGASPRPGDKALYRMPIATGRWERIQYAKSPSDEDMSPQVSPDGRWIAFHRNVSLGDLWRMPVDGGTPQRLTSLRTNLFGLAWTPDSRRLVFSRYAADGEVVLSVLDIASGRVVDFRNGNDSMTYPSVSRKAGTVVFEVGHSRERARRLDPADGDKALARSQVLFESSGSNNMPSPSPDGRQMLLVSDRTGDLRLWWADLAHPDSLRSFEGFTPISRYPAAWREDSGAALVVGRDPAGVSGLYEIDPAAGRLVRLPLPGGEPVYAAYHPVPGRLLVVADRGEGRLGVILYDRSVVPWRALAEVVDVSRVAVDSRNRRILMASMSTPDIRSADFDLANVTTVDRAASQRRNRMLVPTPEGAMVMDSVGDCQLNWRPVAILPGRPGGGRCLGAKSSWLESVAAPASGRALYISSLDDVEVDLGLAPLSRVFEALDGGASGASARH